MDTERHRFSSESQGIIENAIELIRNTVSCERLQILLTEDQAWYSFLCETDLSSDEIAALYGALNKLRAVKAAEEKTLIKIKEKDIKRFLQGFPQVEVEIQKWIEELRDLADQVGKTQKAYATSQEVAGSLSTTSGLLSVFPEPLTGGLRDGLTATAVSLRTATAATDVSSSIEDKSTSLSEKTKASLLASMGHLEDAVNAVLPPSLSTKVNSSRDSSNITENTRAGELAKLLLSRIKCFSNFRKVPRESRFVGGTSGAVTTGSWVLAVARRGFILLIEVVNLVKDSKHLHEGVRAESTEEVREQAQKLERKLQELTGIYKHLEKWDQQLSE